MFPIELQVKQSYYIRVAIIGLLSFGLGALAMLLEQRKWASTIYRDGVVRRDGKKFRWGDLQEKKAVYMRLRSGRLGAVNHYELVFKDGKALVFHLMLENEQQVLTFLETVSPAQGGQV